MTARKMGGLITDALPKNSLSIHHLGKCDLCGEAFKLNQNGRIQHECPVQAERISTYERAKKGEVNPDVELTPPRRSYMDEDDDP